MEYLKRTVRPEARVYREPHKDYKNCLPIFSFAKCKMYVPQIEEANQREHGGMGNIKQKWQNKNSESNGLCPRLFLGDRDGEAAGHVAGGGDHNAETQAGEGMAKEGRSTGWGVGREGAGGGDIFGEGRNLEARDVGSAPPPLPEGGKR